MGDSQIRLLIVDDDEDDYMIVCDLLTEITDIRYDIEWAKSFTTGLALVTTKNFDICLVDYRLGAQTGITLVQEIVGMGKRLPIILLTGLDTHDIDVEAIRAGASDYLVKGRFDASTLERSIRYSIERKKIEQELYNEKERAVVTLESIGDAVITTDKKGIITHINRMGQQLTGFDQDEAKGKPLSEVFCMRNEISREQIADPLEQSIYEILLRIYDEKKNLLTPSVFLPAATRYKMMPSIDRSIISSYFAYYQEHHGSLRDHAYCNINISGASLNDRLFHEFLENLIEQYKIDPNHICFEITETIAIDNFNLTVEFLKKLKALGFKFALDDFGSGMSSFTYLKMLPIDYLKIDGSFVKNIASDAVDAAIIESMHNISHLMNIETIAEGVESEDVLNKLKTLGIDYAQGFFIEKPRPLEYY